MKWQTATLSLTLLSVVLALLNLVDLPLLRHSKVFNAGYTGSETQLGFYDMLADRQERYQPHFEVAPGRVIVTFTSPGDAGFLMRIKLESRDATPGGMLYSYQPLDELSPGNHPIFNNVMNYMSHNGLILNSVTFEGERLLVTPSGQILTE